MPVNNRTGVAVLLGVTQTISWGSSFYLPGVLAVPMARDLGVDTSTIYAALSFALMISALLGPYAGRSIDRWGGRPVLCATNLAFAAGLALLGMAQGPISLFTAWAILGVAMGSGLYEAAFATVVRYYGRDARGSITGITLIAGFASTVGWPLSMLMESHFGWRGACYGWVALQLLLNLPLHWLLPAAKPAAHATATASPASGTGTASGSSSGSPLQGRRQAFVLLAAMFMLTLFIGTAASSHMPQVLQASGLSLAAAAAAGALMGPSQVGARIIEMSLLRRLHPMFPARLATALIVIAVVLILTLGAPAASFFTIVFGAGNGLLTIARGVLPLAIFGAQGYGALQGMLMVPARIAQGLAPWLFGIMLDHWGVQSLWLLGVLSLVSLGTLLALRADAPAAVPARA
jgi:predicted MFS family arabinose efflux permease